jgi:DNA gyrase subunit B
MAQDRKAYNNESISSLKGPDRVRKRPSVIFGSDGIDGCQHTVFEILSNSIDEAREGFGGVIDVIRHKDYSITVQDYGRGMPLDYNNKEKKYNWKLIFC